MEEFIKCRDGKERQIYPALIKHRKKLRHYITRFRTDMAVLNLLSPDLQKVSDLSEAEADQAFSDEPYHAMMELLVIAFGEKYTKEQIEEFVDLEMVPRIFNVFLAISGYSDDAKKKTPLNK